MSNEQPNLFGERAPVDIAAQSLDISKPAGAMTISLENLTAIFADQSLSDATPHLKGERVYRVEVGGHRHYRRESGRLYKSLTTFLSAVMPENKFLANWKENKAAELGSREAALEFVNATADYGTILHIAIGKAVQDGQIDWLEMETFFMDELMSMGFTGKSLESARREIFKDFAGLIQFFFDYEVTVYAVELPVFMDAGVATLIDLVVEMNCKAYTEKTEPDKRKRQKAIINLKSGKKGFFESHKLQLVGERKAFNETYGKFWGEIQTVANLAPTDWRNEPGYKFKDHTDDANGYEGEFALYLQLAQTRGVLNTPKSEYPVFYGVTKFGENPTNQLRMVGYDEITEIKKDATANQSPA